MNSLLTTLIDLVRISASISENPSHLRVAPARDILVDICSPQVPTPQIDQLAQAMEACILGRSATLPSLDLIEPALASPECEARLAHAGAALNELLLLHYALHADAAWPATLRVTSPYVFDYLQDVQISAAPHQPQVVLIGPLLPSQGKVDLRFESSAQLLKRLAISYSANSPYPLLNLKLWSASTVIPAQAERPNWSQKDGFEHDLQVWARNDTQSKGEIRTRLVPLPHEIKTKRVNLSLNMLAGLELRETDVLDSQGHIVVSCLRMARKAAR